MKVDRVTFLGSEGQKLAARLDAPEDAPHAYALFAHCYAANVIAAWAEPYAWSG